MLSRLARAVLDTALRKYRPGRSDLIPVGEISQLKPALQLMTTYRLTLQEVTDAEVVTSYTRWLECVQVKEGPEPEVYVAFSPRFERIWLESRKRLPEYMEKKPANAALRSQYSLRLYSWAKKYVEDGAKTISLEEFRRVLGLESIKDADGNVIREAPLPIWANFQQRALGCRDSGGQREDRFEYQARVNRTLEAPAGGSVEIHDQDSIGTEGSNAFQVKRLRPPSM